MLTLGQHLIVYIPIESDLDSTSPCESKAWVAPSYEQAIESIYEFIWSGEFSSDIDCRFEIFDNELEAVGDPKLFEGFILEFMEHEDEKSTKEDELETAEDVHEAIEENLPEDTRHDYQIVEKPPAKEAKFGEFKIEDNRK